MPLPNHIQNPSPGPFERFYRRWLVRLEELRQLLFQEYGRRGDDVREEDEEARRKELIRRVVAHYADYFRAKQAIVLEDVLILFGPPWLTPLERSLLWIGGFKPGFAFRVVANYVTNLTEEQKRRMARVMVDTAEDERVLMAEFSRVQTRPTAPSLVEMATMRRERVNGERDGADERIQILKSAARMLVECADYVRCKTIGKIMDILDTYQNLKFLLAIAQLQRRIRNWGLHRETDNRDDNDGGH